VWIRKKPKTYPVRSFKHRNEQARAEEVQTVLVYIMVNLDVSMIALWSDIIQLLLISLTPAYNLTENLGFL